MPINLSEYQVKKNDELLALEAVYRLLNEHPEVWLKGATALDNQDRKVEVFDPKVSKLCLGAMITYISSGPVGGYATNSPLIAAVNTYLFLVLSRTNKGLRRHASSLSAFNDHPRVQIDNIKYLVKKAINQIRRSRKLPLME